jgi:hypothetical protein
MKLQSLDRNAEETTWYKRRRQIRKETAWQDVHWIYFRLG